MNVRPLRESDLPALKRMAEASGYPYPDLSNPMIESVFVVEGENGQIVMACAAERIVQLYLFASPETVKNGQENGQMHPAVKLHALRLLHDAMAPGLRAKGYTEANAFIPPSIDKAFGRRLSRTFGWVRNWVSWCVRF